MAELKVVTQTSKLLPDEVVFSVATSEQLTAVWTLNAEAWGSPLSVADHIERERTLSQQPASGDLWTTWVLSLKSDTNVIVASVETFEKPLLVSEAGKCTLQKGYGIASVFTNPQYRGNHMASLLLENLKAWLDGDGEGWVSVLYSDIGADFYARLGWLPGSIETLLIESEPEAGDEGQDQVIHSLADVKPLQEDDLRQFCKQDSDKMQLQLKGLSKNGQVCYAFVPNFETVCWHMKREDLNTSLIHGQSKPRPRGAISGSGRAWIVWHFDEGAKKLKVQRLVTLDENEHERNIQELAGLIRYAQQVATSFNFSVMVIWNPNKVTIEAVELLKSICIGMKVTIEDREGSIASARRKHGEAQDSLLWYANEYYAWC